MDTIYEEDYKGYHICINLDDLQGSDSPRDWDNLGKMVTWHRRYNFGDEQPKDDSVEWFSKHLLGYLEWDSSEWTRIYSMNIDELIKEFCKYNVMLPIYMYDHSGISISTGNSYPFNDRWDAGQLGFIYVSKQKALKEYNQKKWSKKLQDKVEKLLVGEVETYNDYLMNNVFGYQVFELDEDGDYDHADCIDSCWGYYPSHEQGEQDYDYCLSMARDVVDYTVKENNEKQWERAALEQPMGD